MTHKTEPNVPELLHGKALRLDWPMRRIALVTLTRPDELNTLSLELLSELALVLDLAEQGRARALIITGTGRAFCAGAHLSLFTDLNRPIGNTPMEWRDRYLAPIARLFDRFEEMPFPVIAAINGYALGGGCEMALSADFRLMARTAKLGLPEVRLGASPGAGGVQKLIRHVGRSRALEWILLGTHIPASEAERSGLIYEVTDPDQLLPRALELARKILQLGPTAISQAKTSTYVAEDVDLRSARRFGLEALTALAATAEWREGVQAFIEKREPNFE
jgi:enoyl-CoA hydratase/carnithine racemase